MAQSVLWDTVQPVFSLLNLKRINVRLGSACVALLALEELAHSSGCYNYKMFSDREKLFKLITMSVVKTGLMATIIYAIQTPYAESGKIGVIAGYAFLCLYTHIWWLVQKQIIFITESPLLQT